LPREDEHRRVRAVVSDTEFLDYVRPSVVVFDVYTKHSYSVSLMNALSLLLNTHSVVAYGYGVKAECG